MSSTLDPITRRHVEKATESLAAEFAGVFAPSSQRTRASRPGGVPSF